VAVIFSFNNGVKALITFPLWYGFALVAELLLGGPLLIVALRLRMLTWWASAVAGGVVGVAVPLLLASLRPVDMSALALIGGLGAAAGLAFWLVARLGRDPAAPAPPKVAK